jgi:hypothetical protein
MIAVQDSFKGNAFRSLKVLGRPVEYVVHPGATHEITRSGDNRQRMDQLLRTFESLKGGLIKGKRTSINFAYYNL